MINMETRKVQQTGGSSFIISLPKEWIKKHKIKKNDSLGIISQPDGTLLITPEPNSHESIKKIELDVDGIKNYNYLFRLLIGAYIMGYHEITVKSSEKLTPMIRECVTNFTKIAIGPEIFEESGNFIRIKDLLNPKEMPFEKTIKRMYIIAESMHEDAILALKTKDKSIAEQVISRDNDIDRLHWLVGRQMHIVLRDIILCQKMNITLEDATRFHKMSRLLERIGDHAVKIAENVITILNYDIDQKIVEKIASTSKLSLDILNMSMDAWIKGDIKLANETIESVNKLIEKCEEISGIMNHSNFKTYLSINYIAESIRRVGEYAGDISELIINHLIR